MLPISSRKSKIRPPRKSLVSGGPGDLGGNNSVDFEKSWEILSNAIQQIQNKNVSNLSYEQLYRKAYMLVLRKFGGKLYDNVASVIKEHLLLRRQVIMNNNSQVEFMKSLIVEWDEHLQSMKFISDVLMYLNRVYVRDHKKLLIYDLGIQLFKDYVIRYNNNEVGYRVIEIVIDEITRNRKGEVITTKLYITKIINILELLVESDSSEITCGENFYQTFFEPAFLAKSETYFNQLADEFMSYSSGSRYLTCIDQFIKEEENRINFYLPSSTYPKLVSLMDNILIKEKIDKVICLPYDLQGLSYWLEPVMTNLFADVKSEHYISYLSILYDCLVRIDSENTLLKMRLKDIIIEQGHKIPDLVKEHLANTLEGASAKKSGSGSSSFAIKYVNSIIEYQNQIMLIVKEAFKGDFSLEQCVTTAIKDFINAPPRKGVASVNAPELLSIYIDFYIKQNSKMSSMKESTNDDITTDDLIIKSISFLRFIKDKDSFEAHYANHFAKRFLNSKGSSLLEAGNNKLGIDLEELIISKLSEEMGAASLEKVIKMNKDINLSYDLTREWKKYTIKNNKIDVVDLDLKICNVNDWPKSMTKDYKSFSKENINEVNFIWSRQLRHTIEEFEEFWYTGKKNDNKSLFWCPKFGSAELKITYPSKTYDISMSTYAAIIMLLFSPQSTNSDGSEVLAFEESRVYTYSEIKELTGIPEVDLKRQLQSIAVAPRLRLLVKSPMTKDVNESDTFKLNDKFKAPSTKVKVLTVSASASNSTGKKKDNSVKQVSEHDLESDEIQANITEGRKIEVNAAIVRIMKSRQVINHNDLIVELVKQLSNRFQPPIILIKQRIEDLIEKEYLKRDDDDKSVYHYIA